MRVCSVEGCEKQHIAKGFCNTHYRRMMRTGHPLGSRPRRKQQPCSVDGCVNPSSAYGLCTTHDQRKRLHGHPLAPGYGPRKCAICASPLLAKIDQELAAYVPKDPVHGLTAIAARFGVSVKTLTYHNSALHAQRLARVSLNRLEQARAFHRAVAQ